MGWTLDDVRDLPWPEYEFLIEEIEEMNRQAERTRE
jgi:hypothetical protein